MGVQARLKKDRHARVLGEADRLPKWTPFERVHPKLDPAKREALIRDILRLAVQRDQEMTRASAEAMVEDSRITVRVDDEHVIYIDVKGVHVDRPTRKLRRPRTSKLRLVKG